MTESLIDELNHQIVVFFGIEGQVALHRILRPGHIYFHLRLIPWYL